MFSKISLKRIVCFMLALLMLFSVTGCKNDETKKKKRVIIKKVITATKEEDEIEEITTSSSSEEQSSEDETESRAKRDLYENEVEDDTFEYEDDDFPDEFTSQNVDWDGPAGYVIVYSESTPLNLASAQNLQKFFKENDRVELKIYKDTEYEATEKEILVGDTNRYTSSLDENEFAVKLSGKKLIFEGGHKMMVEKAADWFMSVERVSGKVAVLEGKAEDFVAEINIPITSFNSGSNIKKYKDTTYVYAWGDEFDGYGGIDRTRWAESGQKDFFGDIAWVASDLDFNRVEDGRLKMFADRYYSEEDSSKQYATGGVLSTNNYMCFRRGYAEWRAKVSYTRGAFPAWWTRSVTGTIIPSEVLNTMAFGYEIDMFEAFSSKNRFYNTLHKWYRWGSGSGDSAKIYQDKDMTIDITEQIKGYRAENNTWATTLQKSEAAGTIKSSRYYDFPDYENLSNEYHTYQWLWEDDHMYFGVDGIWYSDYSINLALNYDGCNANNNNDYGFDIFHTMLIDAHIYSPMAETNGSCSTESVVRNKDLPIVLYTDYLRLYQDPTDTGVDKDGRKLSSFISLYENTSGK